VSSPAHDSPGRGPQRRSHLAGRCGTAGSNNVETLHPAETFSPHSMFYFHRTKKFPR
jgi:hypothetical protein